MRVKIIFSLLVMLLSLSTLLPAEESSLPGKFQKAYITGTITASGSPVSEAEVFAWSDNGNAMAVSAPNGNYSLGVGAGEWQVTASKEGYLNPVPLEVTVKAEEVKGKVDFVLKTSKAFIEGKVIDEAGKPLPYSFVMAMPGLNFEEGNEEQPAFAGTRGSFPQTRCDREGNFRLQLMAGKYLLNAFKPGYKLSPKNPRPAIPGMENIPAEMLQNIPVMGVEVSVKENETKKGVIIILARDLSRPEKTARGEKEAAAEKQVITPLPNLLVGKACLTPNNVLHWTRKTSGKEPLPYAVVRSTQPFDSKVKGEIKTFQFLMLLGEPAENYYSFTDHTAKAGVTYYYAVYEMGSSGAGPYSNSVKLNTP